jgi:hypothetical protein
MWDGTKPAANLERHAHPDDVGLLSRADEPGIYRHVNFTTDGAGRFNVPRVMPGHYDVVQVVQSGVDHKRLGNVAALDVAAGRSYDLKIGDSGRPVTGRLALRAGLPWMVRKAEIPNLKAVHEAFARDSRFAMFSLSLDERLADLQFFMRSETIPWSEALIGPDSPVAAAYDATAIPATFLIGSDGRILAKDLRGEKPKSAVAEALKRHEAAGSD